MKNIFIALFILISNFAAATTYYISPNGSDSNSGTISSPFFTLNKAWTVIKAGDIIYARGGVYRFNTRQTLTGKNGTASDTIRIWAYPGEKPVFTKSSSYVTPGWPVSLIYLDADYTHWKNIEISHYKQKTSALWYAMAVLGSNHNKFERLNSHHNGHGMVIRDESSNNLVLNSDFHHNYDPLTGDSYGDGDGLEVAYASSTSAKNTIRGCRFYYNSDDGLDLWNHNGHVIIENCWAWGNGYREDRVTKGGDGGGLKFGSTSVSSPTEVKRTVSNCVSVYNRTRGYNQNAANCKFVFYNNIAYKNNWGFVFPSYNLANVFRNNVSYGNTTENWNGTYTNSIKDHNSYDPSFQPTGRTVSSSDYQSLDTTGLAWPRKNDGSLPDIKFLQLASGSDLIDAGVNVGLAFAGSAPDIGPFENGMATPAPQPDPTPVTVVAYVNSEVKNAAPAQVTLAYTATLANVIPATSCFTVKVNNVSRAVNSLSISEKNVNLALASPIVFGDVIMVSYTKPETNPLQCVAESIAESIINKAVVNGVGAVPPGYLTSSIETAAPGLLEMTFNTNLASIVPAGSAFTVTVNNVKKTVSKVTISGSKVSLALDGNVVQGDTVALTYTKPATNPLQAATGALVENITAKPVMNNVQGVATTTPDSTMKKDIIIFPNPAKDYVQISNLEPSTDSQILRVFDFSGKLCKEIKLDAVGNQKIPIDLKPGMYIVQVVYGKIVKHTQKLIVI